MTPEYMGRDTIRWFAGAAHIVTSRPTPLADWTTLIDAPGLNCHGQTWGSGSDHEAIATHRDAVTRVHETIADIPTIHIGLDHHNPDDREPMGGDPYWTPKEHM